MKLLPGRHADHLSGEFLVLGVFFLCRPVSSQDKPLQIGELRVVDGFLRGKELARAGRLLGRVRGDKEVVLNASLQGYEPLPKDDAFFRKLLKKISHFADAHVRPAPDDTDPHPWTGKYFVDSWTLRRYLHNDPGAKRLRPHTDTEEPGRCLSATLHVGNDTGVEGGTLQAFHCPPPLNCRRLEPQDAYAPFSEAEGLGLLRVSQEAAYKPGRIVFFLAGTPHAVTELVQGNRDVLFVWIGCYPTLRSAEFGHAELVERLLDERADLNGGFAGGATALHQAAWRGHLSVVEVLLERRADVNPEDLYHRTPVFTAAMTGQDHVIDRLVEARADICRRHSNGATPVQAAAGLKFHAARDRLLAHGAGRCPPASPKPPGRAGKGRGALPQRGPGLQQHSEL